MVDNIKKAVLETQTDGYEFKNGLIKGEGVKGNPKDTSKQIKTFVSGYKARENVSSGGAKPTPKTPRYTWDTWK